MIKNYFIKNMVCDRCIKVVRDELINEGIAVKEVLLGSVSVETEDEVATQVIMEKVLSENGFMLITNPEFILVEKVKLELIKLLEDLPLNLDGKLSELLASKLNSDYSKISKMFSVTEKLTIEKYFIKLKIEKAKELIQAKELNFTEISQHLDYSNMNYLSRQFKSETGLSMSAYKDLNKNFRISLDQIL